MASSPPPALHGKDAAFGAGSTVRRPGRVRVMHPRVAELLRSPRRHARPAAAPQLPTPVPERARYACAFEDDAVPVAAPGRLVWAKVRNHPWWPGQVFDAADASAVARERRRPRRAVLVAYFWDRTFAWTDAAALLPLRAGFPRLAAVAPVAAAVDAALAEIARRVLAGLSCCCGGGRDDEAAASSRQVIDNAGVRDGACGAAVDAAFARRALQAEALLGYVSALATSPRAGADRVDLTVAAAQLTALGRWRGSARGLPEYTVVHGIDGAVVAAPVRAKAKRRRSSSTGGDGDGSAKRRVARNTHSAAATKGNAACDTGGDYEALELEDLPLPTPTQQTPTPTKIGKLMSRAAQNMSLSPVVLRATATASGTSVPPPPAAVLPAPHMARCAVAADEQLLPARKDGNGDHSAGAGLVLNFSSADAVPSARHLATVFSRFGPVKEVRADNSTALVVFDSGAHADEAFSGTATIGSISASLVSIRVTSSLPAAPGDPAQPATESIPSDDSPVEALR